MLKKTLNGAHIVFHIEATGPLLIKAGEKNSARNNKEDNELVFVKDNNGNLFIPGSSIRGVWRSWCEKIARTIGDDVKFPLACNLFETDKASPDLSCSQRLKRADTTTVYALSCPICKLFGNTSQGSRIKIADAYPITTTNTQNRPGIAVDRFTGGVAQGQGPFTYEYIIGVAFKSEITIQNFELWQFGLLAYLFRDFQEELVPVGFGKTRGFGKVKGTVEQITITYFGSKTPSYDAAKKELTVWGIGSQYDDTDRDNYCFADEPPLVITGIACSDNSSIIKKSFQMDNSNAYRLLNNCAGYWAGLDGNNETGYFVNVRRQPKDVVKEVQNV
jgi:CRISPR-associated RAMP protein (TIGR02581 family)